MRCIQNDLVNIKTLNGLNVNIVGQGDEVIVFLHGGPGSDHRFFLPHVLPLSQRFKLVCYDQMGCGESASLKDARYTMKNEVDCLENLRKELGLGKINLFGESWGSMLALLYATSYPERVNKIVLTAAIGVSSEGYITFSKELENRLSNEDKIQLSYLERKLKNGDSTIEEIFSVLDRYYVYSEQSLMRKHRTSMNTTVNEEIGEDIIQNFDLKQSIYKIKNIPILIAQGSHDILTPDLIKRLLLDYIPHAVLVEIEECGHWTVVEKPEQINRVVNDFF